MNSIQAQKTAHRLGVEVLAEQNSEEWVKTSLFEEFPNGGRLYLSRNISITPAWCSYIYIDDDAQFVVSGFGVSPDDFKPFERVLRRSDVMHFPEALRRTLLAAPGRVVMLDNERDALYRAPLLHDTWHPPQFSEGGGDFFVVVEFTGAVEHWEVAADGAVVRTNVGWVAPQLRR